MGRGFFLQLCLSEGDYQFALAMLQENLGSGAQRSRKEIPASPVSPASGQIMTQSFLPGSVSIPSAGFGKIACLTFNEFSFFA